MTAPPVDRLRELLAAAGFTRLSADYIDKDYEWLREGWRIHDMPDEPAHVAYFICDGLEKEQADLIVAGLNALPALLEQAARVSELEAALRDTADELEGIYAFACRQCEFESDGVETEQVISRARKALQEQSATPPDRECICPRCGIRHGSAPTTGDF